MRGRWLHFLLYVQIYSCFLKNLLAASKVRVRGWYGAAWDELCVNWGRLHPAAVLGAFGGGGEALARATCIAWSGASCNCPHVRGWRRASAASPTWGASNEVWGLARRQLVSGHFRVYSLALRCKQYKTSLLRPRVWGNVFTYSFTAV